MCEQLVHHGLFHLLWGTRLISHWKMLWNILTSLRTICWSGTVVRTHS